MQGATEDQEFILRESLPKGRYFQENNISGPTESKYLCETEDFVSSGVHQDPKYQFVDDADKLKSAKQKHLNQAHGSPLTRYRTSDDVTTET
ncbi:unnamed protein product [Sphenostylis stenocarpa]|uniref:Uncharacterized protein n=1 Tax=Sphenostylis stenocarpa TaxID=92480 RepID=A0AA86TCU8_9FABA|nr:unnamed protein product [Sphenostylis stenocarpa]